MLLINMQFIQEKLLQLQSQHLQRKLHPVSQVQGLTLQVSGKTYRNFASNNYLNLADDPRVLQAFLQAAKQYGVGSGAARLISGDLEIFHQLEAAIAQFKQSDAALLFNSGYMANVGVLSILTDAEDVILSDELNHASLIDGLRLAKAEKIIYPHGDLNYLQEQLQQLRAKNHVKNIFIATETVFSMDGDLAPLEPLTQLCQEYDAYLYLDEAHATGVFGNSGRGLLELVGATKIFIKERCLQMGTLGKALGCYGAYVACSQSVKDYLISRSRTFVYTTALPPAVAAASLQALQIVEQEPERRKILWDNIAYLAAQLKQHGIKNISAISPIIPIMIGDTERALKLSDQLKELGYWILAIRYPTVAKGTERLRLTVSSGHNQEELAQLAKALGEMLG